MLHICCPVQRGTRVAATRHTSSSTNIFTQRDPAFCALPAAAFPAFGSFADFAGEGVASVAAALAAAALAARADAGQSVHERTELR